MNTPKFYNRSEVGQLYHPRLQDAHEFGAFLRSQGVKPAHNDSPRVLLWLIDLQVDFVFPPPAGNLSVPGAVESAARTIEWIYRNIGKITTIASSLDTHVPFQIFHQLWWVNAQGENPPPYTVITSADVRAGKWMPLSEPRWSLEYLDELEQGSKKNLMVWPFHCLEGSIGRSLVPALTEAISVHSTARYAQPIYLVKGRIPQTEYYSVVEPEVKVPKNPEGSLNTSFLAMVGNYDLIFIAGQARSHCVLETVASTMRHFSGDSSILRKFHYLDDCSNSIPGFEAATDSAMRQFEKQGLKLVKSTDPVSF